MKKMLFLLNPNAGMGSAKEQLYMLVSFFSVNGFEVTTYPIIPSKGLGSENILKEAKDRFDCVVCYGGDGTLNHVINGYMQNGYNIPLGYFPAGSTNDFAKSIGLSDSVLENAQTIVDGNIFRYDIGRFNDRYFNYVAAFGAFTEVSYDTDQTFKNVIGHAAYLLRGVLSLPDAMAKNCAFTVEHDGVKGEGEYIFGGVSNSTSVGGFKMPHDERIQLDDGVFEVTLIKVPDNILDIQRILSKLLGGDLEDEYIEVFQTSSLLLKTQGDVPWTLDGEFGGAPKEIKIELHHEAIPMFVPS